MKIIPTCFKRYVASKKILKRQLYRDQLVTISPELSSSNDLLILKDSEAALKAFADKNKIGLNITNGDGIFKDIPKIEIFNVAKYTELNKTVSDSPYLCFYKGLTPLTTIFSNIESKTNLLKTLKTVLNSFADKRVGVAKSKNEFVKILDIKGSAPPG